LMEGTNDCIHCTSRLKNFFSSKIHSTQFCFEPKHTDFFLHSFNQSFLPWGQETYVVYWSTVFVPMRFRCFTSKNLISYLFKKFKGGRSDSIHHFISAVVMLFCSNNIIYFFNSMLFPTIGNWFYQNLKPNLFTWTNTSKTLQKCSHRIFQNSIF